MKTTMRHPAVSAIVPGIALLFTGSAAVAQYQPQNIIGNQAPQQPLTTDWQQAQPDEWNVFNGFQPESDATVPQIFRYGPLTLRPHLDYRFFYGNGILANPGDSQASAVSELSPGIRMDIGAHWSVDYTPTLDFYSNSKFKDTVNHSIALTGGEEIGDWRLGFSHASQFTETPLIGTGAQTEQQSHATGLTASHFFNDKISTDLSLAQHINLVSGLENSYDWSLLGWLNYQFWPRLSAGIGAGGGYVKNEANGGIQTTADLDQTYEQLQARINWRATQKLSFQVSGGGEDRQFMTPGTQDSINPIFSVAIQYQPWKRTEITLSASRVVSTSDYYLAAQEAQATMVALNLNQRLFKKFTLGAGVAYGRTDFSTSGGLVTGQDRTDDNVSFNVRLSHPFLKHGVWSVFYQFSENTSTLAGYGFTSNQGGFEISYRY
jgi:hypothetical protein